MEGDVDNHIRLYSPPAGVWGMKAGEKERRSFLGRWIVRKCAVRVAGCI